jgi:hypothetical protein
LNIAQNASRFDRLQELVKDKGYQLAEINGFTRSTSGAVEHLTSMLIWKQKRDPDKLRMDVLDFITWKNNTQTGIIKYHDNAYCKKILSNGREEYHGVIKLGADVDTTWILNGQYFHILK